MLHKYLIDVTQTLDRCHTNAWWMWHKHLTDVTQTLDRWHTNTWQMLHKHLTHITQTLDRCCTNTWQTSRKQISHKHDGCHTNTWQMSHQHNKDLSHLAWLSPSRRAHTKYVNFIKGTVSKEKCWNATHLHKQCDKMHFATQLWECCFCHTTALFT